MFIKKNPQYLEESIPVHNYDTRHKHVYTPFKHRTTAYEKEPSYSGQKIFNSLPDEIKNLDSLFLFKRALKNYLFEKKIYAINDI